MKLRCFCYLADTKTSIDGAGPDIFVSIGSSLVLTCRVYTAGISLNYLIWRRGDKVGGWLGGGGGKILGRVWWEVCGCGG